MRSDAPTVDEYLAGLPEERVEAIATVRQTLLASLPEGVVEVMNWGMICYEIPLETHPDTYNGKPLMVAALASQKRNMAVYLQGLYMSPELQERIVGAWRERGTRLDMGKSCIRFRALANIELDLVGQAVAAFTVPEFIALSEACRR